MTSFSLYCSKSSSLYRRYYATLKTVRNPSFSKACLLQCCYSITFIIVITVITTANNTFATAKIHDGDDDKSATRPRSSPEAATATIRIGSDEATTRVEYRPPFTTEHYPDRIVKVLQQYPTATETDFNDENDEEMQQLRLASWYVDLGVAHRTVMEDDYMEQFADMDTTARTGSGDTTIRGVHSQMNDRDRPDNDHQNNKNGIRIQKLHAMTAFQEAIRIYETLIRNYRQWLSGMEKQDDIMKEATTVTTTKDMIERLIQEYEHFLADTFFALAETCTLVNDDMTSAFQYYRRAYDIYHRQRQIKETEHDTKKSNNKSDMNQNFMNIDIHYAHCSMQLGLESLQFLHDMDVMEYEDDDTDDSSYHTDENHHHRHIMLSEIMEKSRLTFDHEFWKTVLTSFPYKVEDEDYDDYSNSKDRYTLESLQDDLRSIEFFIGSDVRQVDLYIGQYILTEQAIVYFSDSITIFRQVISQHHLKNQQQQQQQLQHQQLSPFGDVLISNDGTTETSMIINHQQTLVDALQNLATCIYQYRPTSNTVAITKAVEYYEEAYDVLSSQIIPSLMQQRQQQHRQLKREQDPANERHSPGSNNEVIRTVHAMIDILFILSEMYFLLGDDERSKERMQRCLQYHEEYHLDPPSNDPLLHGSSTVVEEMLVMDDSEIPSSRNDLLLQYEQLLADYNTLVADNNFQQQQNVMNDDQWFLMDESNEYYYEKDDVYEADIHVSIGILYMEEFDKGASTSSRTEAMTHFEQALRLYDRSFDVDSSTNMALAKYNLFLLHLRDGNYRVAARRYNEAIDLLRRVETTSADMDEDLNVDYKLLAEIKYLQQNRNKRNQQLYPSTKPRKTLLKAEANSDTSTPTSTTDSSRANSNDKGTKQDKASIYVDLHHFLSQNESTKEEL